MKSYTIHVILSLTLLLTFSNKLFSDDCIDCHKKITPGVVIDWQLSKHSIKSIGCSDCHGSKHKSAEDVANVQLPTPEVCGACHENRLKQFKSGKHASAWTVMNAMPTIHWQPMSMTQGQKGCGGCHKIGIKTADEIKKLKEEGSEFGHASCDGCHTRHTFSVIEARQPQACETCHMGFDHPQWEMYSGSKMGIRFLLKQEKVLPEETPAPTCQTCHMPDGDHGVKTAWGFLAVRLPMPDDKQWADDRTTILKGLGVLDPDGKPTGRLDAVKAVDLARLTQEDWNKERTKMINTCSQCHASAFAKFQLDQGDDMIKQADRLMAEAINIVAGLYKDKLIDKPKEYAYDFPDLLTFHDAATPIEQKLFVMFLEHRMRTFEGTFHSNPDYAMWYGWSEMKQDLSEIRYMSDDIRSKKK